MNLNQLAEKVLKINEANGFWDARRSIPELIYEGMRDGGFSSEESFAAMKRVADAFRAEALMLVTTEVAEAMECLRKDRYCMGWDLDKVSEIEDDAEFKTAYETKIKDRMGSEIAGTIIRLLDYAAGNGIDIQKHVDTELRYNSLRGHMHGGKNS